MLPELAEYWDSSYIEFLDKEIYTDIAVGDRHEVDLLVKTRFRGRGEVVFLIHLENQSAVQSDFAERMFVYFARLYEKFRLPIYPVALFSHDQPIRAEPDQLQLVFPDRRVLEFNFRVIQLNRLNWLDYVRNPNPVASALMTKMRIAPEDRPRVKLECLRMMVTLKLDRARMTLISAFMDNYLKLTAAEQIVYNRELEAVTPTEREAVMEWTNEWIEKGRVEGRSAGLLEGRNEGALEGRRTVITRILRRQLGTISSEIEDRLRQLSGPQLEELADAVLDFHEQRDIDAWLTSQLQ